MMFSAIIVAIQMPPPPPGLSLFSKCVHPRGTIQISSIQFAIPKQTLLDYKFTIKITMAAAKPLKVLLYKRLYYRYGELKTFLSLPEYSDTQ